MKILILYGTTEGQTRKIADFAAERLRAQGDNVTVTDAGAVPWDLRPKNFDAAILAASLHDGVHQKTVIDFARTHHGELNAMPSAFLSVSLSAAGRDPDDLKNAQICAELFRQETGWTQGQTHHIAGAFRFSEYDFFKRWTMKIIAWERNLKVSGVPDLELTDWDALGEIVDAFRALAAARRAPAA